MDVRFKESSDTAVIELSAICRISPDLEAIPEVCNRTINFSVSSLGNLGDTAEKKQLLGDFVTCTTYILPDRDDTEQEKGNILLEGVGKHDLSAYSVFVKSGEVTKMPTFNASVAKVMALCSEDIPETRITCGPSELGSILILTGSSLADEKQSESLMKRAPMKITAVVPRADRTEYRNDPITIEDFDGLKAINRCTEPMAIKGDFKATCRPSNKNDCFHGMTRSTCVRLSQSFNSNATTFDASGMSENEESQNSGPSLACDIDFECQKLETPNMKPFHIGKTLDGDLCDMLPLQAANDRFEARNISHASMFIKERRDNRFYNRNRSIRRDRRVLLQNNRPKLTSDVLAKLDSVPIGSEQSLGNANSRSMDFFWLVKERAERFNKKTCVKVAEDLNINQILANHVSDDECSRCTQRSSEESTKGTVNHRCRDDGSHINMCDNPADLWYGLKTKDGEPVVIHPKSPRRKHKFSLNRALQSGLDGSMRIYSKLSKRRNNGNQKLLSRDIQRRGLRPQNIHGSGVTGNHTGWFGSGVPLTGNSRGYQHAGSVNANTLDRQKWSNYANGSSNVSKVKKRNRSNSLLSAGHGNSTQPMHQNLRLPERRWKMQPGVDIRQTNLQPPVSLKANDRIVFVEQDSFSSTSNNVLASKYNDGAISCQKSQRIRRVPRNVDFDSFDMTSCGRPHETQREQPAADAGTRPKRRQRIDESCRESRPNGAINPAGGFPLPAPISFAKAKGRHQPRGRKTGDHVKAKIPRAIGGSIHVAKVQQKSSQRRPVPTYGDLDGNSIPSTNSTGFDKPSDYTRQFVRPRNSLTPRERVQLQLAKSRGMI